MYKFEWRREIRCYFNIERNENLKMNYDDVW